MKVGFLSDKNGFRAPLHPDSLQKYDKTQWKSMKQLDEFEDNKYRKFIQNAPK